MVDTMVDMIAKFGLKKTTAVPVTNGLANNTMQCTSDANIMVQQLRQCQYCRVGTVGTVGTVGRSVGTVGTTLCSE